MRTVARTLNRSEASLPVMVVAGAVLATWTVLAVFLAGAVIRAVPGGGSVGPGALLDIGGLAPLVAALVVLVGVPIALLTERLCRGTGTGVLLAAFVVAGLVAGAATSLLITGGVLHQFLWLAAGAAVLGRAGAGPLATRPPLLGLVVLLTVAATVGSALLR
ncbi:hypothetical protein [Halosaccharopolyspora lacisalsi]|nr:hypothetical protein [Halosaccharopolyspora lacisalsi]